jgi:hypothetical protein
MPNSWKISHPKLLDAAATAMLSGTAAAGGIGKARVPRAKTRASACHVFTYGDRSTAASIAAAAQ